MASIGGWRVVGKRAGLVISAALSVGAAVMLVFKLVTPQAIAALGTPELVGLLMLLAMPMAGVWARRRHAPGASEATVTVPSEQREIALISAAMPKRTEDGRPPLRHAA